MTDNEIRKAFHKYRELIDSRLLFEAQRFPDAGKEPLTRNVFEHCAWMISEMDRELYSVDQILEMSPVVREKSLRWLGFIEAVLWSEGIISLSESGIHN
jgi:hypothetical protein